VLSSCKEDENESPEIKILTPEDGTWAMPGDQFNIKIKAYDEDGSVDQVVFYIDGERLLEIEEPPYEYLWVVSDTLIGDVQIKVIAVDNDLGVNSAEITVTVDAIGGFNPDLTYGTMEDIDGNSYRTITIGNQNWMAENLKVTHYADGTPILFVTDDSEWNSMEDTEKAYCWYNNMSEYGDTTGALYNWGGAMNGGDAAGVVQGVCPEGWHMPGDEEWKELEMQLGMSQAAADAYDWRGTDEGGQLKEKGFSHWGNPNSGGANSSGFTALPGGFRSSTGTFYGVGEYATYWTTSEKSESDNIWYRVLNFKHSGVYRHYNLRNQGYSVRCVEDL